MVTFVGYTSNEEHFLSAEDRGIAVEQVDLGNGRFCQRFRPMTVAELAARDARKAASSGLKVTVTDGNGDFIRNDHDAEKP